MKKITKPEAAQLLGCAERQIQRYAQAGKLTVEYVQEGKARKAMYAEAEVRLLKQQQEAPELRGVAVRLPQVSETPPPISPPLTIASLKTPLSNPMTLPPQALQVLQMLGTMNSIEEGKCVSVEEIKFDKLSVGTDGTTRMAGVSVARYSARA